MNQRLSLVVRACLTIAVLFLTPSCEDEGEEGATEEEHKWLRSHLTGTWELRFASGESAKLELHARAAIGNFGGCSASAGGMRWLSTAFACGMEQPAVASLSGQAKSEAKHLTGALSGSGRLKRRRFFSDQASVRLSLGQRTLVGETDGEGTLRGTAQGSDGTELGPFEARKLP